MNKTKGLLFSLPIAALCLLSTGMHAADKQTDYTKYVNPFVGNADNGHTFPGACRPFGMIQTSPVTGGVGWRYCAEYVYSDSIIWGSHKTILTELDVWILATFSLCRLLAAVHDSGTSTARIM